MKAAVALYLLISLAVSGDGTTSLQNSAGTANPVIGDTYITVHNVNRAHQLTRGAGTRVGILDTSFGRESHPELYAGGKSFSDGSHAKRSDRETHQGYWMALALQEVVPEAEIFALDIPRQDESARVEAMIRALEWAVAKDLDVVTYCGPSLSDQAQRQLDPVVEQAVAAGVVVVFADYQHPSNLLPGGFGPSVGEGKSDPDLNIFSYDCTNFMADHFVALVESDDDEVSRYRPFLARPAVGPITAGLVALVRSVDPEASPAEVKKVLRETSRPMVVRGRKGVRVPDAFQAVARIMGTGPESTPG